MKDIQVHNLSFLCVNSLLKSLCTYLLEGCPPQHIWIVGNGYCIDATNNANCNFDGGDCCDPNTNIFSIVLDANNLSYVKSIEIHACTFSTLNVLSIGTVYP